MKITTKLTLISSALLVAGCAHDEQQAHYRYDESLYSAGGPPANVQNNTSAADQSTGGGAVTGTYGSGAPGSSGYSSGAGESYPAPGATSQSGYVADEGMQRSEGSTSDLALESEIRSRLATDAEFAAILPSLQITVINGAVSIAGVVLDEQQKQALEARVHQTSGVHSVKGDRLRVSSEPTGAASGRNESNQNATTQQNNMPGANGTETSGANLSPTSRTNEMNGSAPANSSGAISAGGSIFGGTAATSQASSNQLNNGSSSQPLTPTSDRNDQSSHIYSNATNNNSMENNQSGNQNQNVNQNQTGTQNPNSSGMNNNSGNQSLTPTSRTNSSSQIYSEPSSGAAPANQNQSLSPTSRSGQPNSTYQNGQPQGSSVSNALPSGQYSTPAPSGQYNTSINTNGGQ